MRKLDLLNSNLISYLSTLGHQDITCIADAGLPIASNNYKIDLALMRGLPSLLTICQLISQENIFEKAFLAAELPKNAQKALSASLQKIFGKSLVIEIITHQKLKEISKNQAKGVIRTGENMPFHNVLLVSGVKL